MFLRFSDADRERWGLPEWVDGDWQTMTVAEAEALEAAGGKWSTIADEGLEAAKGRIWLALYRAGVNKGIADLGDVQLANMRSAAQLPGKGEATSEPGSTPTSPTSASSTRRSTRRKSAASR